MNDDGYLYVHEFNIATWLELGTCISWAIGLFYSQNCPDVYFSSAFFKDYRLLSLMRSYKSSLAIDQKLNRYPLQPIYFYLLARYFVCDEISSLQTFISHHGCYVVVFANSTKP